MQLPDRVKAIRARYVARFPVPHGSPGEAFEDTARQWSIRFAEQVASELGPQWGMKRADGGRPISKDTIALNQDGRLLIWDLLSGTGTGSPRLVDNPESEDITGQVFVPVQPVDHLGAGTPSQPPVPPPVPPVSNPVDFTPLLEQLQRMNERVDALIAQQQGIKDDLQALKDKPDPVWPAQTHPVYDVRIAGRTVGDARPRQ